MDFGSLKVAHASITIGCHQCVILRPLCYHQHETSQGDGTHE
jgi:hypothetical protein